MRRPSGPHCCAPACDCRCGASACSLRTAISSTSTGQGKWALSSSSCRGSQGPSTRIMHAACCARSRDGVGAAPCCIFEDAAANPIVSRAVITPATPAPSTPSSNCCVHANPRGATALFMRRGLLGAPAPPRPAAAVSVPFDLAAATTHLAQGFSRVYERRLLRCLQDSLVQKSAIMELPWRGEDIAAIAGLREFDERVTAPLHGFRAADDYYAHASCRPFLPGIAGPTLIVHALDDPFMPPSVVPRARELAAKTLLEISTHGGHVGFVHGAPHAPRFWLEQRVPEYLAEFLSAADVSMMRRPADERLREARHS